MDTRDECLTQGSMFTHLNLVSDEWTLIDHSMIHSSKVTMTDYFSPLNQILIPGNS